MITCHATLGNARHNLCNAHTRVPPRERQTPRAPPRERTRAAPKKETKGHQRKHFSMVRITRCGSPLVYGEDDMVVKATVSTWTIADKHRGYRLTNRQTDGQTDDR